LDADWKHKNRLIHHADQAKVSAPMPTQKCLQLGWCVCSPEGRVDMQLRNRLFRNIKLQCRVGSEARRLLIGGFVVIELRWARDTRGPSKWSAFALGVDHEDALPADQQQDNEGSLCVHIGSMSLSPYRPKFQLLDKLDDRPASCYVWVKARMSCMHEFQLCHHLHKGFTWSMSLYRLVNTDEPVGVFDPESSLSRGSHVTMHNDSGRCAVVVDGIASPTMTKPSQLEPRMAKMSRFTRMRPKTQLAS
jgi:hypothetical protein